MWVSVSVRFRVRVRVSVTDKVWVPGWVRVKVKVNPNLGHLEDQGFTNPEKRLGPVA